MVIPTYHHCHRGKLVPVGTRSADRRKNWIFDVGAQGMCDASITVDANAYKEMYEELGLSYSVRLFRKYMPHEGYGSIVYVFTCDLGVGVGFRDLASTDGTFEKVDWVEADESSLLQYMRSQKCENPGLSGSSAAWTTKNQELMISCGLLKAI